MRKFWFLAYNYLFIPLMWFFFHIGYIFSAKIRNGINGRRKIFKKLANSVSYLNPAKRTILIHSSSLGEFQQALPLINEIDTSEYNIVFSFFSPSGFNNARINLKNSFKTYLPFDSYNNAKKFLDIIEPDKVIFMRYDLWFNFLYECKKRNIPTILANARYDIKDISWKFPLSKSFKINLYNMVDKLFVIDKEDEINFKKFISSEIKLAGDSKFERVLQASKNISTANILPASVIANKRIFVIGSSWKDDEDILLPVVNKLMKFHPDLLTVLVPHEPKEKKIERIEQRITNEFENLNSIRFSELHKFSKNNLIIVDKIGHLMKLYSIAYFSYVGGGFRTGLHNIVEPAVYNMPIFFSNRAINSDDSEVLLKAGCGVLVDDQRKLYKDLSEILYYPEVRNSIASKCELIFENSLGIAKKIISNI